MHDWIMCAEAWVSVLGKELEAKKCLKKAEKGAKNVSDWIRIAHTWKELNALYCLYQKHS